MVKNWARDVCELPEQRGKTVRTTYDGGDEGGRRVAGL